MSRAPQRFRMREAARGLKAADQAGFKVSRFEIGPDGTIRYFAAEQMAPGHEAQDDPWNEAIEDTTNAAR